MSCGVKARTSRTASGRGSTSESPRRVAEIVPAVSAGTIGQVRYLGSLLVRRPCRFEGAEEAARDAATRAGIPFERILETARSPWPEITTT
ncbi:MAG TPA: hypothetical protein VE995_03860 [Gaiellaceae bacterium]|nr:hypothetical protein [Gaiellaceae bacterium]